jgi:hypothetical protein
VTRFVASRSAELFDCDCAPSAAAQLNATPAKSRVRMVILLKREICKLAAWTGRLC